MGLAVLESENVAGEVECANLPATVGEQFVTAYRPLDHLVEVFGRLSLAENLGTAPIFEFA